MDRAIETLIGAMCKRFLMKIIPDFFAKQKVKKSLCIRQKIVMNSSKIRCEQVQDRNTLVSSKNITRENNSIQWNYSPVSSTCDILLWILFHRKDLT